MRIGDGGGVLEEEILTFFFVFFSGGGCEVGEEMGFGLLLAVSFFEWKNGNITACNLQNGGACFEIRMYSH